MLYEQTVCSNLLRDSERIMDTGRYSSCSEVGANIVATQRTKHTLVKNVIWVRLLPRKMRRRFAISASNIATPVVVIVKR